jgi:hypothetical protein
MEVLIVILVVGGAIAGVWQNHTAAATALEGVEFTIPAAPAAVRAAINSAYAHGAKAKLLSMASGIRFTPTNDGLRYETKTGDAGRVVVRGGSSSGTAVRASATELFVGHPAIRRDHQGIWAISIVISHGIFRTLGLAPNAAKIKRFQAGLEGRLVKELAKAAQPA